MPTFTIKPTFSQQVAKEFVSQLGETPSVEEVLCICPFCDGPSADKHKKTLTVNINKGKFYCFHCHRAGGSVEMASGLSVGGGALFRKAKDRSLATTSEIVFDPVVAKVRALPPSIRDRVHDDLAGRLVFSVDEIDDLEYGLSGSRPKKWTGRIIISTDGVRFGKSISSGPAHGVLPKYLTEPNFKLVQHGYIGINELLDTREPAVLAEGLLDYHSLPPGHRLMSPGTSGLSNDLVRSTSFDRPLIVVPDGDDAGVRAFLSILNRGLTNDPRAHLRFFFVYWLTDHVGDDINDLHRRVSRGDKGETYRHIVAHSIDAPSALKMLDNRFRLRKTKSKGWILLGEDKNGKTGPAGKDTKGPIRRKTGDGISWF